MNERIQKLADEAGLYVELYGRPWPKSMSAEECEAAYQKFAQLIVRECVRYFNEDYVRDFDTLWREDLSKGIKEHFGVEE